MKRHPAKSEAKNPGGFLVALLWIVSLVVALGGFGVIGLHMFRILVG